MTTDKLFDELLDQHQRDSVIKRKKVCPNCGKTYEPDLQPIPGDTRLIQYQFPSATAIQREQLITGICSDKCWDEFLGPEINTIR